MRRLQRMQCYMQRACWLIYHRALPQVFGRNKTPLKAVCRTLDVDVNVHKQYTNQIHQIYKALILPFIQPGIVYTYQHTLLGACSPASMPTPALHSSACLSAGSPCEAEGLVQETPPPPLTHTHTDTRPQFPALSHVPRQLPDHVFVANTGEAERSQAAMDAGMAAYKAAQALSPKPNQAALNKTQAHARTKRCQSTHPPPVCSGHTAWMTVIRSRQHSHGLVRSAATKCWL